MGKNQDPGSGIQDKNPGSATLVTGFVKEALGEGFSRLA
jgi:hypothetical protein